MRVAAALVAAAALLFEAPAPAGAVPPGSDPDEPPATTFSEAIDVSLLTLVVRVVDSWGNPILGLQPGDFRVRVGKRPVPVVGVDWIAEERSEGTLAGPLLGSEPPASERGELAMVPAPAAGGPGRLVVVFVQADLNATRISGQMRLRPYTRELLATLPREDRIAVVSFDSHLKLWQDFELDRAATHKAIDVAVKYSPEVDVHVARPHSLARHFDFAAAHRAASPERALEVVARAMAELPGEKTMIFLGWGLGRYGANGVQMTPDYGPAVRALHAARASVFVLDVTSADYHSLSVGLESVAASTGGLYFSTFRLPGVATRTLVHAISGYYVLTLDSQALADASGPLRVETRRGDGTVLTRPVSLR
jgi:VWFA-related protein